MKQCQINLSGCTREGYKKMTGKWHCKYCLDETWAVIKAIKEFSEEQKSNSIKFTMEELQEKMHKTLLPLRNN